MYNDIYIYLYTYIYLYVIMVLYNTIFWSQGTAGAGPESPLDEVGRHHAARRDFILGRNDIFEILLGVKVLNLVKLETA